MFRCLMVTVATVLALPGQSDATVNIWLSGIGTTVPGSSFPIAPEVVPVLEPYLGGAGTIFIWGRPDMDKSLSLVNLSLNLVAETQPICNPGGCSTPNAIAFTSATMFNPSFGPPTATVRRFEYVDDSTAISANRVEGMEGFQIFNQGTIPAVGIGSTDDLLYDSANISWLIAQVAYNAFATGENSETRLFLQIGRIGLNHAGETTADCDVVFGDATDDPLNGRDDRGMNSSNFDALIRPRPPLPGDADRNGAVEPADYAIWRANFGSTMQLAADHNDNDVVDAADYVIWRKNLGLVAGSGGAIATPEPSAAVLVSIAMAALLAVCRLSFDRAKS